MTSEQDGDGVAAFGQIPGVANVVAAIVGLPYGTAEGPAFRGALEAVRAAGLDLPADASRPWPGAVSYPGDRVFPDDNSIPAMSPRRSSASGVQLVMAAASLFGRGVPIPATSEVFVAEKGILHGLPGLRAALDQLVALYGARTYALDGVDGRLAVRVAVRGGDLEACLVERVDGVLRMECRLRPSHQPWEGLAAVVDAESALALWTAGLRGEMSIAPRRGAVPFPRLRNLAKPDFGDFDERECRAIEPLANSLLDVADEVSFRRIARAMDGDPAARAALLLDLAPDAYVLENARSYMAGFRDVGRLAQGFVASPALAGAVRFLATHFSPVSKAAFYEDDFARRVAPSMANIYLRALAVCPSLEAGISPREIVANVLAGVEGFVVAPVVAATFAAVGGSPPPFLVDDSVWPVCAAVGAFRRHRALDAGEVAALGEIHTCIMASVVNFLPPKALNDYRITPARFGGVAAASRNGDGRFQQLPEEAYDMLRWTATRMARAGLSFPACLESALSLLFPKGRTRGGLGKAVARWHATFADAGAREESVRFEAMERATAQIGKSALFPRLDGYPNPHGLEVEQIVDRDRCVREGAEMEHCVATYSEMAASGNVLLFSIRGDGERSTASLSISWRNGAPRFAVGQVKGARNAKANEAHETQARTIVEWSRTVDALGDFPERLAAANDCARRIREYASELCDADKALLADAAFDALKPYMARDDRPLDRLSWLAREEGIPR